jgi:hypothetical protein
MLRVIGGMLHQPLLVGLLLVLMPTPFPASANIKYLPTPVEASKKYEAGPIYTRLAEGRIEGLKEQQPVAVTSRARRIPTIQLLDCRTLTDEEVCKGLMCTWEAARCHETTGNASPNAAPPGEEPPR